MKYDNKRELKQVFGTKQKPVDFILTEMSYLTISGKGNPNELAFQNNIQALYSVIYTAKFAYKKKPTDDIFDDYVVAPLTGWWTISEEAIKRGSWTKDDFIYELRIMIPYFVSDELIKESIEIAKAKKGFAEIDNLQLKKYPEMHVGQILHIGSYDDEQASFEKLESYLDGKGLKRKNKNHVEIYLSDARRIAPDKQKTILQIEI